MKQISEHLASSRQERQTHSNIDTTLAQRLFVRLNSIYGHQWSRRFETPELLEAALREWGKKLNQIDVSLIGEAIEICPGVHKQFPPSLGQFMDLVKSCRPVEITKALPKPKTDPKKVERYLEQLREKLK